MKTIQLTDDLQRFLHEAVHSGRYASEDSVISDALTRLRQAINAGGMRSDQDSGISATGKQLTKHEFQRHLVELGLVDPPMPAARDSDQADRKSIDDDEEILSEVVIRERLIEWLTGFLER